MPTTHNIKPWVIVAGILLIFLFGIGIPILVIYILVRLAQPATNCTYCDGETYPVQTPMFYAPVPVTYAPEPPYGYYPYPAPAGRMPGSGTRQCPHCYAPVPMDNRYCPGCGRRV